ncbi:MAG TPA: thioredoxin-dependent thiol peroxidase, partial [Ilumatobacteraceae bacterium]|nr:thioredoxin-dependent thiol peroxidase [Ilumatobacteraceae bacterium]
LMLTPGDIAPTAVLDDQDGNRFDWSRLKGHRSLLFFYPKASTPGCTQQACGLRDVVGEIGDTQIIGVSPDKPSAQKKFADKFALPYPLLADVDHQLAEAYSVWKQKSMYGRTYMGIERSAFLIDAKGRIEKAWYKISPKDTPLKLLEALQT